MSAFTLLVLALVPVASAHEVRPGYLDLLETRPGTYDITWKKPAVGDAVLRIEPTFPPTCDVHLASGAIREGAFRTRGTLTCPGGLAGATVSIAGLAATLTDVFVRVRHADGTEETHLVQSTAPSMVVGRPSSAAARALAWLGLGIEHILFGLDHLLFVLGLLLLVGSRRALLGTITAFTVAHSLTLGLATLGVVHVPTRPVEAAIALSILLLGPEIARTWRGESSFTIRRPWVVAFAFGLLHGFGFASGLSSTGLPSGEIPLALLCFNVGVELGQLCFVALVLAFVAGVNRLPVHVPIWVRRIPAYAVGSLGAYWLFDRIAALLGVG